MKILMVKRRVLCSLKSETHTTSEEIKKRKNNFMISKNISLATCIGICTDNTACMTRIHAGLVTCIKEFAHM